MSWLYDKTWLDTKTAAFVEEVRQLTPVTGHPPTGTKRRRLHGRPAPEDGGWAGEEDLVQADYLVRVTDPRWFEGLRPGVAWMSSWYPVCEESPSDPPAMGRPDDDNVALQRAERLTDEDADLDEVRQAFEAALPLDARLPPLAEVGLYALTGNPHALASVLERLRADGGADYSRACRLAARLGSRVLMSSARPVEHSLMEVLARLDGGPEPAANALWLRGRLSWKRGAYGKARRAWAEAAATGIRPYAGWAANGLAAAGGTIGHDDRDARLIVELADELYLADHFDAALHAYSLAGEVEMTGKAAHISGDIHRKQGRPAEAAAAYERTLELADGWNATLAAYNLAQMRWKLNDLDGAVEAAREAHRRCVADREWRERRAMTATRLGDMLALRHDWAEAAAAYEEAIRMGERKKRRTSWSLRWTYIGLGQAKSRIGETDAAKELLQDVVRQCGPVFEGMSEERRGAWSAAAELLGHIAKERRDVPEADSWYRPLIAYGTPSQAAWASAHLAELHYWLGHEDKARGLYQRVLDRTDEAVLVAEAAYRLGELAAKAGDVARATTLLETAIATDDPSFAPQATDLRTRLIRCGS